MKRKILICLAVLTSLGAPAGASEAARSFRSDYVVSYLGLTVARSNLVSTVDGRAYSIEGSLASAGLGAIFDNTKATLSVSGRVSDKSVVPDRARTAYKHDRKSKSLDISFAKGNVTKTVEEPPPKPRGKDWVQMPAAELRAVSDPISALLVPAESTAGVCARKVRIYDGEMRADLALSHDRTGQVALPGFKGEAVTCKASFLPIAGYPAKKKSVKFMRDKGRITITFAQLGTTGIYAPVRATVGTEIGTLTLTARRFEAIN